MTVEREGEVCSIDPALGVSSGMACTGSGGQSQVRVWDVSVSGGEGQGAILCGPGEEGPARGDEGGDTMSRMGARLGVGVRPPLLREPRSRVGSGIRSLLQDGA